MYVGKNDEIQFSVKSGSKERRIKTIYIDTNFRISDLLPDLAIIELDAVIQDPNKSLDNFPLWSQSGVFYPGKSVGELFHSKNLRCLCI